MHQQRCSVFCGAVGDWQADLELCSSQTQLGVVACELSLM